MSEQKIREQKRQIRKAIAAYKKEVSADWIQQTSTKILSRLEVCALFQQAKRVLLYHALPDEVQTASFLKKWYHQKELLLPVVEGDHLLVRNFEPDVLQTGSFGILEPTGEDFQAWDSIDLVIVPGVAFDLQGNRLGRGKGYYDRLLPMIGAPKIGIAFSWQILEQIPVETTDQPLTGIITDKHFSITY